MSNVGPIRSFTQLDAWQEAHRFVLLVYRISRAFPADERFGLTDQLRRAIVSIVSNIAEGFSRNSFKEKLQFYTTALGSLSESQAQLLVARDLGYVSGADFETLATQSVSVSKLLHGLTKKTRSLVSR